MEGSAPGLTAFQAALLGLVHGPTELLPVSSSAHTALIPWLLRWPAAELDPDLRKSLEVALHTGAGLALALDSRAGARPTRSEIPLLVLSLLPPATAGYLFEGFIERRLSGPRAIAAGLLVGSLGMWLADGQPGCRGRGRRGAEPLDGLVLGLAQAAALVPGVSRSGATLTAARLLGFRGPDAQELSRLTAGPVIAGASVLKARRLFARGLPPRLAGPLALAAASSLASTLLMLRLRVGPGPVGFQGRGRASARRGACGRTDSLRGYALYRCGLALLIAARTSSARGPRDEFTSRRSRGSRRAARRRTIHA